MLFRLAAGVPVTRCMLHAGETVYRAGDPFVHLHVLNSGVFKIVSSAPDGRCQVVGLHFRGDWLGFDGMASGRHGCEAVALDTGEVWALRYDALLFACAADPALMVGLHAEMGRAMAQARDAMLARCTLPAVARVADFLGRWADSLSIPGHRADQIMLRMTRADIGNYLGMTLESVSRAMSRLAHDKLIRFAGSGRRTILIPDLGRLDAAVAEAASAAASAACAASASSAEGGFVPRPARAGSRMPLTA